MTPRSLTAYALCPECLAGLEEQRAHVGERGIAVAYCDHVKGKGTFAIWSAGDLVLKPCNSVKAAQQYEAQVTAMIARVQLAAERLRGGAGTH